MTKTIDNLTVGELVSLLKEMPQDLPVAVRDDRLVGYGRITMVSDEGLHHGDGEDIRVASIISGEFRDNSWWDFADDRTALQSREHLRWLAECFFVQQVEGFAEDPNINREQLDHRTWLIVRVFRDMGLYEGRDLDLVNRYIAAYEGKEVMKVNRKNELVLSEREIDMLAIRMFNGLKHPDGTLVPDPRYTESVAAFHRFVGEWCSDRNGRAKERLLDWTDVLGMQRDVMEIISQLRSGKKAFEGVKFVRDPNGQRFPNAYKWTPYSTVLSCSFKGSRWTFSADRTYCRRNTDIHTVGGLPESVIADIKRNF